MTSLIYLTCIDFAELKGANYCWSRLDLNKIQFQLKHVKPQYKKFTKLTYVYTLT